MRTRFLRTFILLILVPLLKGNSQPLIQSQPKNQVIDTIRCTDQKGQSYALYVPAQYDQGKQWPVIMIFDPAARGKLAVELFREAGSKYGYILACSNNSRNGPVSVNLTAAWAVLQDLDKRLSIDQKRIFVAGFSGGSRFAMTLAGSEKIIAGVIGCGAGLPNDQMMYPSPGSDFLYYGLAGTRDMNYPEMHDLIPFLQNQTKVVAFVRTFEGGHQWPESALLTDAVEWITFQSMKRKTVTSDYALTETLWNKTRVLINFSLKAGDIAGAVQYMRFAARDFEGTPYASEITKLLSDSENSSEYRSALKDWNRMARNEQDRKEKYFSYLNELAYSGNFPDSASDWWNREAASLIRLREKGNPSNSRMASRVLNFISVLCSEQGTSFYRKKAFAQSAVLFQICTISDSENPMNYYNLSRALAANGKLKESVNALASAVGHGPVSRKAVEADPVFDKISGDKIYKALLPKMK